MYMLIHVLAITNLNTPKVTWGKCGPNRTGIERIRALSLSLTTGIYCLPEREPRHTMLKDVLKAYLNPFRSKGAGIKTQKLISRRARFKVLTLTPKCTLFVSSEMGNFAALLMALHCLLENSPWHTSVEWRYCYSMRCQHNILLLNVLQECRGGHQGYLRITGCTNCSGTAIYKGIFFFFILI